MNKTIPGTVKEKTADTDSSFFMAAALCMYTKDDVVKQRHVNVLAETHLPQITKMDLNTLHRTAMQRLNTENDVTPEQILDIVFVNISFLGTMPPQQFYSDSQGAQASENPSPL